MRTLPYPPIHFLFLWLKNKLDFAAVVWFLEFLLIKKDWFWKRTYCLASNCGMKKNNVTIIVDPGSSSDLPLVLRTKGKNI